MARVSAKGLAREALREEKAFVRPSAKGSPLVAGVGRDSFVNFLQGVGLGASNSLQGATYGFNPITRNRILLEWIHRGSWLGGMAVDIIADDMTRKGVELLGKMDPSDMQKTQAQAERLLLWDKVNAVEKWGRLYGGAIGAALVDGQDPRTPLDLDTVGRDQFKGLIVFDRWQVTPALEDLVTELGPHLGQPKFYRVQDNAPALRGAAIHHSRVLFRNVGVELPYQQSLTENLWGISIFERFYDRMVGFDSATMGAAQLVSKAHLRTLKIKDMRQLVAAGGELMVGLTSYIQTMRQFQGNESITTIDGDDEFDVQQTSAFSGVADVVGMLSQHISGALGIPLVRLLGQSPGGLNASGESDWRNYNDGINARQNKELREGTIVMHRLCAQNAGVRVPEDFGVLFRPLLELSEKEKAEVAETTARAVLSAKEAGAYGTQTTLKELKQSSTRTGVFSNITQEQIEAADDEIAPPMSAQLLDASGYGQGAGKPGYSVPGAKQEDGDGNDKARPDGQAATVDSRPRRRRVVLD